MSTTAFILWCILYFMLLAILEKLDAAVQPPRLPRVPAPPICTIGSWKIGPWTYILLLLGLPLGCLYLLDAIIHRLIPAVLSLF